ncbi:hypothetical protein ACQQ2N_12055 [Dokdonella sp. MW10]|uniref:hypothetical protein n=1 Tax=Dokdonella sp. MW10 TaxID=2992926 RepID=UPI003F7FA3C2
MPSRWRDYALASITPGFSWAQKVQATQPDVFETAFADASSTMLLAALGQGSGASLNLSVSRAMVDDRAPALSRPAVDPDAELPRIGLQRYIVAPSYVHPLGPSGSVGVTAVLAYQRFASLGLGSLPLQQVLPYWNGVGSETSYGAGIRLDVDNTLSERLSWSASYQSQVDMDAFKNYRGVYAEPGQFDIPASASFGLSYALTRMLSFDVGVQRVMYSGVKPFTSSALPTRFLALLGTGASPEFAWKDLDVYSAGWTFRHAPFGELELRYTTRQQPVPTARVLERALGSDPSDHAIALGYARAIGRHASLSLQTVYSTAPYFLGVPSYRTRDPSGGGDSLEFEAMWAMRF